MLPRRFYRMDWEDRPRGPEWLATVFRVLWGLLLFGGPILAFFRWLWK
jgi:hypothetical protein